jgi:hypothetical protein
MLYMLTQGQHPICYTLSNEGRMKVEGRMNEHSLVSLGTTHGFVECCTCPLKVNILFVTPFPFQPPTRWGRGRRPRLQLNSWWRLQINMSMMTTSKLLWQNVMTILWSAAGCSTATPQCLKETLNDPLAITPAHNATQCKQTSSKNMWKTPASFDACPYACNVEHLMGSEQFLAGLWELPLRPPLAKYCWW